MDTQATTTTGRRLVPRKVAFRKIGCGTTFGHSLINSGKIKAFKMGGRTVIDENSVDDYLASLPPVPVQAA